MAGIVNDIVRLRKMPKTGKNRTKVGMRRNAIDFSSVPGVGVLFTRSSRLREYVILEGYISPRAMRLSCRILQFLRVSGLF